MSPQELIFKLTKLQRIAIVVAVCALLIVAFYFFVLADMFSQISRLESDIQRVKLDIGNQEKILKEGPKLRKQIKEEQAKLEKMVASLPQRQEIEQLLKKITDLLSENNLTAARFVPGQETKHEELYYAAIPIRMSTRGDFRKQGAFLASLLDLPRIVNVPTITLRPAGGLSDREKELAVKLDTIPLDAEISGVTYRRLSPEEIKQIAAQKKQGKKRR